MDRAWAWFREGLAFLGNEYVFLPLMSGLFTHYATDDFWTAVLGAWAVIVLISVVEKASDRVIQEVHRTVGDREGADDGD